MTNFENLTKEQAIEYCHKHRTEYIKDSDDNIGY